MTESSACRRKKQPSKPFQLLFCVSRLDQSRKQSNGIDARHKIIGMIYIVAGNLRITLPRVENALVDRADVDDADSFIEFRHPRKILRVFGLIF